MAIAFSCLLVGGLAYLQGRDSERRDNTPKAYEASAKKHAERTCVGMEPGAVFECVYDHVEASTQAAHDKQDLSAQQRAATSALASAVFALLTLGLSGLGVWYVKRTLDATLAAVEDTSEATKAMGEANDIARQSLSTTNRAWIEIAPHKVGDIKMGADEIRFSLTAKVTNIGNTVALRADCFGILTTAHMIGNPDTRSQVRKLCEDRGRSLRGWIGYTVFPNRPFEIKINASTRAEEMDIAANDPNIPFRWISPAIILCVEYRTIFDAEDAPPRQTIDVWHIKKRTDKGFYIEVPDEPIVSSDQLVMVHPAFNVGHVT
ncbi:hypothetical protein O4H52_17985 [Sphingomonadaceae bacterium G21617-S1]|nr:hypothetical protein [Sphingomonadaceae bacterium G21617-S1]